MGVRTVRGCTNFVSKWCFRPKRSKNANSTKDWLFLCLKSPFFISFYYPKLMTIFIKERLEMKDLSFFFLDYSLLKSELLNY